MLGSLTESEIDSFLGNQWYGHLGCHSADRTYVVPISFVFVDGCILGQTKDGLKIHMLRNNPQCCVQVEDISGIADWTSVIAWGEFEELTGFEAISAMKLLIDHLSVQMEKLGGSRSPRDVSPGRTDGKPVVDILYRIRLREKTGRFETSQKKQKGIDSR